MADPSALVALRVKRGIALALFFAGTALAVSAGLDEVWVPVVTGVTTALLGLSWLAHPIATVSESEVHVYTGFSLITKKFAYGKRSDLHVSSKLVIDLGPTRQKTGVARLMVRSDDWAELRKFVRARPAVHRSTQT